MNDGTFLYRCPTTQMYVEGKLAVGDFEGQRYVAQRCPMCQAVHLVDPLLGALPSTTDALGHAGRGTMAPSRPTGRGGQGR